MEILNRIKKTILYLFLYGIIGLSFAQSPQATTFYNQLDFFLSNPTPKNLDTLTKKISSFKTTTNEAQLAKVVTLCNMGYYAQKFNNLLQAIQFYEEAKKIFFSNKLSNYDIIEYCLKPLGNIYTQTNAFTEAENTIKYYLLLAQKHKNKQQETAALLNLSIVYKNETHYNKAIILLKQAKKLHAKNPLIELQLAENYILNKNITQAETELTQTKTKAPYLSKKYELLAKIESQKKNHAAAEGYLTKALKFSQKTNRSSIRDIAKLYVLLAKSQTKQKQFQNAEKNLLNSYKSLIPTFLKTQYSPKYKQLYAENTFLDALDLHAFIKTLENKKTEAILLYEKASFVSNLLVAQTKLRQSKLMYQTQRKNRFEKELILLFELYKKTQNTIWLQKALRIDMQSKSFVVSQNKKLQEFFTEHKTDSLVNNYLQLNKEIEKHSVTLKKLALQQNLDIDVLFQLQEKYAGLITKKSLVFNQLKKKHPTIVLKTDSVSITNIKDRVSKNQTLVSYFFGTTVVFQFQIKKNSVTFNQLAATKKQRDSLFTLCVKMNGFFKSANQINNHPQDFTKTAYMLFSKLNIPKQDELLIIPDGILSFIPFDALITTPTNTSNYTNIPFLVNQSVISYELSLAHFLSNNTQDKTKETSVLGFFPVFKNTNKTLQYSVKEAEAISDHFAATILKDTAASSSNFLKQYNKYDIIHLSTHAQGGTFTSPAQIEFIDKNLSVETLYGLKMNNSLVVLSACETGVGKLIKGEGVINLSRGFQYAGVKNVLFTLWNVNDYAAASLMEGFYKNLSEGLPVNLAINFAKRNYLLDKTITNTKKSPFYWASFVYYGKPYSYNTPKDIVLVFLVIGIIGVCGIILYKVYKKLITGFKASNN